MEAILNFTYFLFSNVLAFQRFVGLRLHKQGRFQPVEIVESRQQFPESPTNSTSPKTSSPALHLAVDEEWDELFEIELTVAIHVQAGNLPGIHQNE